MAVLIPKQSMTFAEKLYICLCIRHNRFRYCAFGREANRTLRDMLIPSLHEFPAWVHDPTTEPHQIAGTVADEFLRLQLIEGASRTVAERMGRMLSDLFEIQYGNSYELCNMTLDPLGINFISRRTGNNGVSTRVAQTSEEPFAAGNLTVSLSANPLETYVQFSSFYTAFHIAVLTPRKPMSLAEKLFYALAIKANGFRYGYGRQANRTLPNIQLPAVPDWVKESTIRDAQRKVVYTVRRMFATSI